jgi:gluconate kinase
MKSIVLLSGPVGAGKTTIAKELIASSTGTIAYIEGDTFWSFIAKGGEDAGRYRNFKMIISAMIAAALPYALYGYETIVDFSIPPALLETAHKIVKGRVPVHYIVLRPSETVCASRAAKRPEGTIADYSSFHDFYTSFDEIQKHIIADDTGDALTTATYVREAINEGLFLI